MSVIDEGLSHVLEKGLGEADYKWRHKQAFRFLRECQEESR